MGTDQGIWIWLDLTVRDNPTHCGIVHWVYFSWILRAACFLHWEEGEQGKNAVQLPVVNDSWHETFCIIRYTPHPEELPTNGENMHQNIHFVMRNYLFCWCEVRHVADFIFYADDSVHWAWCPWQFGDLLNQPHGLWGNFLSRTG